MILRNLEIFKSFFQLIKEKHEELENHSDPNIAKSHPIFINQAINLVHQGKFTEQDVLTEAMVMVFGSYETTASILNSCLICLAMYPEYQERLYEEILDITGEDEEICFEHLNNLPYMDMIVNEVLRLLPPIPFVGRKVTEDVTFNELVAPKDLQFLISVFHLHRNEKYWGPNANEFDPDNFLPDRVAERHPYAFIPFAKGIRNCIGRQYALFSVKVIFLT